ncbi:hypothetical protein [Pandoraea apista]|uniref:Uncharacterized protein n=1 Tax=Pandoraea apista TaxID=93218 RepID=A0ABX9ZP28_9BURK|nr:hypothetical protein [Pandoraea apista]RRJ27280.1 hypothetical protein EIB05_22690 [Pandoraea apista]RRJ72884.1 hypothetical protein EIL82_23520 [Pandoraea apista]RSC98009.1 hypothetical protein EJB12_23170 [Pandoraea apista]RSD08219.1 hypothetical protein EIZ52_24825 [Pandoraea apista]RSK77498.1 hypothetical protein EJE96_22690 [Pandoraea apista]
MTEFIEQFRDGGEEASGHWGFSLVNEIDDRVGNTGGSVAEEVTDGHGALHAGLDAGVVRQQAVDQVEEVAHDVVLRFLGRLRGGSAEDRGDDADQAEECGKAVSDDGGHIVSP